MKQKFQIEEHPNVRISLGSTGLTPAGTFFIALSAVFAGFVSVAIFSFVKVAVLNANNVSAMIVMALVLLSSIILFLVSVSLSWEEQVISVDSHHLVIRKIRPVWPDLKQSIDLRQVDGFAMEKLGFNFINVWYAFIFHKDFGAEVVENFLSPQVRISGRTISFLEYADEESKKMALDKLKKALPKP